MGFMPGLGGAPEDAGSIIIKVIGVIITLGVVIVVADTRLVFVLVVFLGIVVDVHDGHTAPASR